MADSKKHRIELTRELVFIELFDYRDDIRISDKDVSKARAIFEEKNSMEQGDESKQTILCLSFWGDKADDIEMKADEMTGKVYMVSFNVESRFIQNKDGDWVPITEATAFKWEEMESDRPNRGRNDRKSENRNSVRSGEKKRDERRASPLYGGGKDKKSGNVGEKGRRFGGNK